MVLLLNVKLKHFGGITPELNDESVGLPLNFGETR